jgi:CheY-like chemotaxis protein
VLEPFRSGGRGTKADGLGLALVASMVEALEGTIRVVSKPGEGTLVELTVPFYVPAAPPPPADRPRFEGTVLLADDDRANRQALRRLLESFGFAVAEADSGTVALAQFADEPGRYKLMILDVVMPGTPIEELVVRARELRADIPVLLISGYGVGMMSSVLALGGLRFLAKPVERDALVATLRDLTTDHGG